ncbi:MAG: expansin EXLX1 family cellulose-binding protein [Chloroflexales bacterium]
MRHAYPRIVAAFALASMICLGWTLATAAPSNPIYLPLLRTLASTATQNPLHSGQATYYTTADGTGNCGFAAIPGDLMVAAISYLDYSDPQPAAYCGAYVEVTGPKGTIMVRIVDKCPDIPDRPVNPTTGCAAGHLDLSPSAFDMIADHNLGRVPITWRVVSPNLSGPISYHFKDGSNQWWTAVQIRNHRNPVVKLEYQNRQGAWVSVARLDYNYFVEASGMGPGPYTFRVTDSYGNLLVDSGIIGGDAISRDGAAQFPAGP